MNSKEFAEWQAFHQLDPIGSERDDYRATIMTMIITEIVTGTRPDFDRVYRTFRPFDYERKKQTRDEMEATMRQLFKRHSK